MTPDDRLAAFVVLIAIAALTVTFTIAGNQILGIIRDRPVVVRDLRTRRLIVVRSPNPYGKPRHHGPPARRQPARNPRRVVRQD